VLLLVATYRMLCSMAAGTGASTFQLLVHSRSRCVGVSWPPLAALCSWGGQARCTAGSSEWHDMACVCGGRADGGVPLSGALCAWLAALRVRA
jgi:hypothetical protein